MWYGGDSPATWHKMHACLCLDENEMHHGEHTFLTSGSLDPRAAEAREEYKGQWAFETLKSMDDKNTHAHFFAACYVSAWPSNDACLEFRWPPNIQSIVVRHVMLF